METVNYNSWVDAFINLFDNSWTDDHIVTPTPATKPKYNSKKERARAANAKHRSDKLQQTPKWSDKECIRFVYILAERCSQVYGVQFDVDHIVPLNGKLVSGLHTLDNLRPLEHLDNVMKNNTFDPDNVCPEPLFSIPEWLQKHNNLLLSPPLLL